MLKKKNESNSTIKSWHLLLKKLMQVGKMVQTYKGKKKYHDCGMTIAINNATPEGYSMFQEFGCSLIKVVCELDSEHRKTIKSISGVDVKALRRFFPNTRRPERTHL